eukprot:gene18078-biopygen23400
MVVQHLCVISIAYLFTRALVQHSAFVRTSASAEMFIRCCILSLIFPSAACGAAFLRISHSGACGAALLHLHPATPTKIGPVGAGGPGRPIGPVGAGGPGRPI